MNALDPKHMPILCASRTELVKIGLPSQGTGVFKLDISELPASAYHYINRNVVDTKNGKGDHADLARKYPQLLGYIIVRHEDKILSYSRGTQGNEERLYDLRSIGFGGHSDISDFSSLDAVIDFEDYYLQALRRTAIRELQEEIDPNLTLRHSLLRKDWVILDNIAPPTPEGEGPKMYAGESHLGLVYTAWVTDVERLKSNEETPDLKWQTLEELQESMGLYEPWSQLLIKHYLGTAKEQG